ncbi:MAG: hypothetical protein U0802_04350 [Candidatus Binatia bacterium]
MWKALRAQGVFRGQGAPGTVAFLYTGQGSQYVNMLADLRQREPLVADVFAEADRVMTPLLGHLAGAATEVTDHPVLVEQPGQRRQVEALAEQLAAPGSPTARRCRAPATPRPPPGQHARQPAVVLRGHAARGGVLAQQRPQSPRRRVEGARRQAVVATGALRSHDQPAVAAQNLEVPADRRLRQLQDRAQLGHRQLVSLYQAQQPGPGRVGERRHPAEHRRGGVRVHP